MIERKEIENKLNKIMHLKRKHEHWLPDAPSMVITMGMRPGYDWTGWVLIKKINLRMKIYKVLLSDDFKIKFIEFDWKVGVI